jgi:hypothetical protein
MNIDSPAARRLLKRLSQLLHFLAARDIDVFKDNAQQ